MMWAIVLCALANALVFAHAIANPMIMADNWLFVDTFLRHVIDGQMTFGDFLVKRSGLDHGLPHYKLLMLLNARFFGLDFSLESMLGVVFAALGWFALYRIAGSDMPRRSKGFVFHLAMAALAAVYLSLNAYYLFLYSMVTLSFLSFLMAFLLFHAAWLALRGGSLSLLAAIALIYAVSADTSAIITNIGLCMALGLAAWHLGAWRRAAQIGLLLVAVLLVAQQVYGQFGEVRGSTLAVFNVPFSARIEGLGAQWRDAWRWVTTPLSSGAVGMEPMQYFIGDAWPRAQAALGVVLLLGHLWFWWSAFRHAPRAASFTAVCIMLLFYGYVAGLLYGRVFLRGGDYLDQSRYTSLYQLGIVALLMMAASRLSDAEIRLKTSPALVGVSVLLLVLQLPLTIHSWSTAPGIHNYYRVMAGQYGAVLRDPAPGRACVDQLTLCQLPTDVRLRVLHMLQRYRLNLYSPQFQERHPELVEAASPLPDAL